MEELEPVVDIILNIIVEILHKIHKLDLICLEVFLMSV